MRRREGESEGKTGKHGDGKKCAARCNASQGEFEARHERSAAKTASKELDKESRRARIERRRDVAWQRARRLAASRALRTAIRSPSTEFARIYQLNSRRGRRSVFSSSRFAIWQERETRFRDARAAKELRKVMQFFSYSKPSVFTSSTYKLPRLTSSAHLEPVIKHPRS